MALSTEPYVYKGVAGPIFGLNKGVTIWYRGEDKGLR
jgi:hypothetical protein